MQSSYPTNSKKDYTLLGSKSINIYKIPFVTSKQIVTYTQNSYNQIDNVLTRHKQTKINILTFKSNDSINKFHTNQQVKVII